MEGNGFMKPKWQKTIETQLAETKLAWNVIRKLSTARKDQFLRRAAQELIHSQNSILRANAKDVTAARKDRLSAAMLDRLTLTPKRIEAMALGIRAVAGLKDPVGHVKAHWKRPNGLKISRVSVPIGVILIIYESRPNVTVECAALCFKSGNAAILRGGRESFHTNQALAVVLKTALKKEKLPEAAITLISTTDREAVDFLLKRDSDIHLVIPRGGETLIRKVVELSRIPVIKHYQGICHVYVDKKADFIKAEAIVLNAKIQRPGVCNAMETLLVHQHVAARFLPEVGRKLSQVGCELRADKKAYGHLRGIPGVVHAQPQDFGHEFLEKILAVKVVKDLEEAMEHIRIYGSAHTDAIVTEDKKAANIFKQDVDSASVMVNASTRFADGFEYGFGAEIGISTDKIHARGPMGLEGLTSYKYIVEGQGQIRV